MPTTLGWGWLGGRPADPTQQSRQRLKAGCEDEGKAADADAAKKAECDTGIVDSETKRSCDEAIAAKGRDVSTFEAQARGEPERLEDKGESGPREVG